MHPAASIIAFTTLSGLGFGLMAWLAIGAGPPPGSEPAPPAEALDTAALPPVLRWLDRVLSR